MDIYNNGMEKKNILLLLTPKNELALIDDSMSIRQALEKMRFHGFTSVPVINKKTGEYIGSISEGDLLWNIVDKEEYDINKLAKQNITKLVKTNRNNPVRVNASMDELIKIVMSQNYVPIVDDRNVLMGIVTRKSIISQLLNEDE